MCERVGIDVSNNTLIMKVMYVDYDQPMDVLDDDTWLGYIDDILRKEPVKLCVNAEPVMHDDDTEDENEFDLNDQPHLENDRGIEDFTFELDCNRNSRGHVGTSALSPHETAIQPNITSSQQVIDITSEPNYDWRIIANMIRQPIHTPRPNISQPTHTPYIQQQFDGTSHNVNIIGTSQQFDRPPLFMPTPMQACPNIGGSFTSFLRAPFDNNLHMPTPMQAGPNVGGSFTSYLRAPLEQNPDIGHGFSTASTNRNRGVHFGSDIPAFEFPPCPRVGAFQNEDSGILYIGKKFRDKDDMQMKMSCHALKNNYMWKPIRSDKEKLKLRCFSSAKCEWQVVGRKVHGCNNFEITAYNETHTCGLERLTNDHRQAKPGPIGRLVRENLLKLGSQFTTKHLMVEVKRVFNIDLDYQRAYHCRQKAMQLIGGSVTLSYSKLPAYFYMLKSENPGTVTNIETDRVTGRFKYCFMALKASIDGFKYCRPVLVVDGTHLKTKCDGTLLVAIGVDAGDHLFPVSFAVTDGESRDAWTYFMLQVKGVIGERDNLVFVSDRGAGIIGAVRDVFPNAHHGFCYHHLVMNLNKKFGSTGYCPYTFWEAAYTFSKTRFEIMFQQLKEQDQDPTNRVSTYLEAIGFPYWARSQFPGTRYAIMTSNYAESFNNVIRDARKLSIVNLLDHIRGTLQEWHCKRRELAMACRSVLAPEAEKFLSEVSHARRTFTLTAIDRDQFQVGDIDTSAKVNMAEWKCYCGQFQGIQMPCVHACAAISERCESPYDYCSPYYKAQCFQRIYEGRVYPVPVEDDWILPASIRNERILPPEPRLRGGGETQTTGARRGRPRILRIASQGEPPGGRTSSLPNDRTVPGSGRCCSLCRNPGHRRPKCPFHPVVVPH